MKFGISTIDITPPIGVALSGYEPRPSTWVEHPLRAEALACEANGSGWILVTVDVGGFSRILTDLIREDIAQRTGLPPTAVMITATHTHSGPHVTDALRCERSEMESAYFVSLRKQLVTVAEKAWQSRTDGELLHGRVAAPDLASNRRAQNADGIWINVWKDPEGKNLGYYDSAIDLLGVRRPDGCLAAVLVNYGCHPVCYGAENEGISADYVGYMKDALEAMGVAKTAMFTVSGHGNIDPRNGCQASQEVVRRMGEDLAAIVAQGITNLMAVPGTGVSALQEPWSFCTTWNLSARMSSYFPHSTFGKPVDAAISCVAVGDCVLLGLPGEAVSEYRKKFSMRSPFGITLLVSLANDFVGYLPTDEILKQGAYEAKICPCCPLEEVLTEHVDAVLAKAKKAIDELELGCQAHGANDAERLYAGTAKVDITPPEENAVDLVGKKLTIHEPIYARVVVLKNGETSVAIVSLDLILFASAKVVSEAKAKWGVDHVILSSTHTHSSMAPKGLIISEGQPDWTRHNGDPREVIDWPALSQDPWYAATEEKIVAAIGDATHNLFPALIAAERRPFESDYLAHNRRLVKPDGGVTMMWRNPDHILTEPLDPTLSVIRVDDETGKTRAVLVHYACHAVTLMNAGVISRDFPGAMVDYIEEQVGEDCMAMYLQGAAGDLDPYDVGLQGEHGFDIVRRAGASLGKAAVSLAKDITMPQTSATSLRIVENIVEIPYRQGDKSTAACIVTLVLNQEFALATIPGEPFIQHQLNLAKKSPIQTTLMLSYAYSGRGCPFFVYIPTAQAVKEGGYGATQCSFVSADAGDRMVNAATAAIMELKSTQDGCVQRQKQR